MPRCPSCSRQAPQGSRFCPACGAAMSEGGISPADADNGGGGAPPSLPDETGATVSLADAPRNAGAPPGRQGPGGRTRGGDASTSISDAPEQGRFLPGVLLAGRYRIVGLIGRGGMGEVYRADDLKLGQIVALKFLPPRLADSDHRMRLLLKEVRLARQVAHPNVCGVYDIGEADGQMFISMEFVDGEDLARLLRRIGRLPADKGLQIARQLCAGLAAAHEKGVVHRDLKPANIMIDGRGHARITDFGVAELAAPSPGKTLRAGTPAYMAPEQLAGGEATARSDVYALGMVLYELFTGEPAYRSEAVRAARSGSTTSTGEPRLPSSVADQIDPAVERVIRRCLAPDPSDRPPSALAVAAALPGGDPLAAVLAAGETPSPQMVAAAGGKSGLRPAVAMACLAATLLGLILVALLSKHTKLTNVASLDLPPQALAVRADQILDHLGYDQPPADTDWGFDVRRNYLQQIARRDPSPDRWKVLQDDFPPVIEFWYRRSPEPMVPLRWRSRPHRGEVTRQDPPLTTEGMATVVLDSGGRLRTMEVVLPRIDSSPPSADEPDFSAWFTQDIIGVDLADLRPASPTLTPNVAYDHRRAFSGVFPGTEIPIHVEAAAYRGRPVFFALTEQQRIEDLRAEHEQVTGTTIRELLLAALFLLAIVAGAALAWRNLKLHRGDRRGAFRIAAFLFTITLLIWLLMADHVLTTDQIDLLLLGLASMILYAVLIWLFYLAVEPYTRRIWPQMLITWTRLLDGRFRDPLVGRDVLLGVAFGVLLVLLAQLNILAPAPLGLAPPPPLPTGLDALLNARELIARLIDLQGNALWLTFLYGLFLLTLFRVVLRRPWLANAVWVLLITALLALTGEPPVVAWSTALLRAATLVFLITRFGLLATGISVYTLQLLLFTPITPDLSAWHAPAGLLTLAVIAALGIYGFVISLGGRPLFAERPTLAEPAR